MEGRRSDAFLWLKTAASPQQCLLPGQAAGGQLKELGPRPHPR
ncbi:MAG: hypothetical protein HW378_4654, partial [Anaerolineales bacterium]|nr:hypothetical protein [Anaerolineales bacterium]